MTIRLRDASMLVSRKVTHPLGHFQNPAPRQALKRKFDDCLHRRRSPQLADALYGALDNLPALETTASLFDLRELDDA